MSRHTWRWVRDDDCRPVDENKCVEFLWDYCPVRMFMYGIPKLAKNMLYQCVKPLRRQISRAPKRCGWWDCRMEVHWQFGHEWCRVKLYTNSVFFRSYQSVFVCYYIASFFSVIRNEAGPALHGPIVDQIGSSQVNIQLPKWMALFFHHLALWIHNRQEIYKVSLFIFINKRNL